jgi:hypothetical protein
MERGMIKTELENLIPKIKSQVKQWRGKISTDVQSQIFEVINELVAAQDKIAELEKENITLRAVLPKYITEGGIDENLKKAFEKQEEKNKTFYHGFLPMDINDSCMYDSLTYYQRNAVTMLSCNCPKCSF